MAIAMNKEQATNLLHQAPDDQVKIWHDENNDCHIVIVATETQQTNPSQQESQGAKIARILSQANFLGDGVGDELRSHIRDFRENFEFRNPIDIDPST